jgi:hypothetical protein
MAPSLAGFPSLNYPDWGNLCPTANLSVRQHSDLAGADHGRGPGMPLGGRIQTPVNDKSDFLAVLRLGEVVLGVEK